GLLRLRKDVRLQARVNVAEQDILGLAICLGQLGAEVGEDVELSVERLARGEVRRILADPLEGLAARVFDAAGIDTALAQRCQYGGGEVGADHADHAHRRKQAGRDRGKRRGAADHVLEITARQLQVVQGHGANHGYGASVVHAGPFRQGPVRAQGSAGYEPGWSVWSGGLASNVSASGALRKERHSSARKIDT